MYLEVMGKKHEHLRSKYVVGLQAVIKPRTFPSACHCSFSVAVESVRQIWTATWMLLCSWNRVMDFSGDSLVLPSRWTVSSMLFAPWYKEYHEAAVIW